jgi:hypothetical protein
MSVLKRLANVAWFRARKVVDGEAPVPGAAALDAELEASRPARTEPVAPSEPAPESVRVEPPAPRPRRL